MPTPTRGREEREGRSQDVALARPNPVDLSIDPTFARPGRPIARGMLQFLRVAGASVRAEHKKIEGMASKARA
jgi:hypothetical protein